MQNIASSYKNGIYSLSDPLDSYGNYEFFKKTRTTLEHISIMQSYCLYYSSPDKKTFR